MKHLYKVVESIFDEHPDDNTIQDEYIYKAFASDSSYMKFEYGKDGTFIMRPAGYSDSCKFKMNDEIFQAIRTVFPKFNAIEAHGNLFIIGANPGKYINRIDCSGILSTIDCKGIDKISIRSGQGVQLFQQRTASGLDIESDGDVIISSPVGRSIRDLASSTFRSKRRIDISTVKKLIMNRTTLDAPNIYIEFKTYKDYAEYFPGIISCHRALTRASTATIKSEIFSRALPGDALETINPETMIAGGTFRSVNKISHIIEGVCTFVFFRDGANINIPAGTRIWQCAGGWNMTII